MSPLFEAFRVIANRAADKQEKFAKHAGLRVRSRERLEQVMLYMTVLGTFSVVLFAVGAVLIGSRVKPLNQVGAGLLIPMVVWYLSTLRPFSWAQCFYLYENYSVRDSLRGEYKRKADELDQA